MGWEHKSHDGRTTECAIGNVSEKPLSRQKGGPARLSGCLTQFPTLPVQDEASGEEHTLVLVC